MAAAPRTLSPEVAALARDFQRTPAGLVMEKKALAGWHRKLKALPSERHAHLADELLALSAKFRRLGGPATAQARAQLSAVAALLILSAGKSRTDSSFTDASPSPRKKR